MELSSAAIATAGLLPDVNAAKAAPYPGKKVDGAKADSSLMAGKIALEEHFALPETIDNSYAASMPEIRLKIQDMDGGRIAEMDRGAGATSERIQSSTAKCALPIKHLRDPGGTITDCGGD